MKKIVTLLLATVLAIGCLALVACGNTDVKGKTFVFDSIEVEFSDDATDQEKEYFTDEVIEAREEVLAGSTLEFGEDGILKAKETEEAELEELGEYTQDGDKVTVEDADISFEVSGKKVIMVETMGNITVKYIYKLK